MSHPLTPAFPTVEAALLEEYATRRREAEEGLAAMPPLLRRVVMSWHRHHATSCLAGLRPSWFGGSRPPLVPAPRGYLDRAQRHRLAGAQAALQHVEARIARTPDGQPLVADETPFVLHALVEGPRVPTPSAPGLVRTTHSQWDVRGHPYRHPPPEDCSELLAAVVHAAGTSQQPGVVVGAWLAFVLLCIHPFADGNGRVARLLHLLVSGRDGPLEAGLGIAELWAFHRHEWQRTLQEGNRGAEGFAATELDAGPFASATIRWSIDAAALTVERCAAFSRVWRELSALDDPHRAAVLAAALHRFVTPEDLPGPIGDYPTRLHVLLQASAAGMLARVQAPPSRREPSSPSRPHFAVTPEMLGVLDRAVTDVLRSP